MTYRGKRTLDLVIAIPTFIVTVPVQMVAAAAVRATLGSPVFFQQERPGLYGAPFTMVKLRTLHDVDPSQGRTDDASRMTGLGRFLRATSIDELPTLLNIIRGDMSLVGPRPLLMEYLDHYTPEQALRHNVLPGLTGLAQVSGRNTLTWDERFRLDLDYVRDHNLRTDLAILCRTAIKVVQRDGISAPGEATMTRYGANTVEAAT